MKMVIIEIYRWLRSWLSKFHVDRPCYIRASPVSNKPETGELSDHVKAAEGRRAGSGRGSEEIDFASIVLENLKIAGVQQAHIAVKVINHLGDEVMKVFSVGERRAGLQPL